jgi:hypothetical protein
MHKLSRTFKRPTRQSEALFVFVFSCSCCCSGWTLLAYRTAPKQSIYGLLHPTTKTEYIWSFASDNPVILINNLTTPLLTLQTSTVPLQCGAELSIEGCNWMYCGKGLFCDLFGVTADSISYCYHLMNHPSQRESFLVRCGAPRLVSKHGVKPCHVM